MRILAHGFWLTPRPASEAIPAGMRRLRITVFPYRLAGSGREIKTAQRPVTVIDPRLVERVATLLNALPVSQPTGPLPCPAPFGVVLRLAFYRDPHDRSPAAVVRDNRVPCGDIELELNGHGEPPLQEEGELPSLISETIGVKLNLAPPRARSHKR